VSFADAADLKRPRRSRSVAGIVAWIVTAIMAATVCYSVFRIPLQVTDSLIPMLDAQRTGSVVEAFGAGATNAGYFRPLRAAQIQALFELSNGHYFAAYKTFQAAGVVVVFVLFLLVLEVDSTARLAALLFALTVLMGLHTFRGSVWEAYPVNHSLEVVACCLLALVLARSRGGAWVDVVAVLTFVAATFTVESGVLVWIVIVSAWLAGARGISRRGVLIVTGLLAAYFVLRFTILHTGVPALSERGSGFGVRQLSPDELQRRFGSAPYVFYAYNVLSSIFTILFSEPRAGIWTIPAEFMRGRVATGTIINVASSTITTALIAWFVLARRRTWMRGQVDRDDQIGFISVAVIFANAAISYSYTKDEIMGPGGVFYALAAFVAAAWILRSANMPVQRLRIVSLAIVVAASGWVVRTAGLHYQMHVIAFYDRNEWVYVDDWLAGQKSAPTDAEGKAMVDRLRTDAIQRMTINPYLLSPRLEQWFR
jgi:hypothetical protein